MSALNLYPAEVGQEPAATCPQPEDNLLCSGQACTDVMPGSDTIQGKKFQKQH